MVRWIRWPFPPHHRHDSENLITSSRYPTHSFLTGGWNHFSVHGPDGPRPQGSVPSDFLTSGPQPKTPQLTVKFGYPRRYTTCRVSMHPFSEMEFGQKKNLLLVLSWMRCPDKLWFSSFVYIFWNVPWAVFRSGSTTDLDGHLTSSRREGGKFQP